MANANKTAKTVKLHSAATTPAVTEIDNDLFVEDEADQADRTEFNKQVAAASVAGYGASVDDTDIDPASFDQPSDDDSFVLDFTLIDAMVKTYDPLPEGQYEAVIAKAEGGKSKKDDPQITLTWRILGGEFEDRELRDYLTFTDKAMWSVVAKLQAIGLVSNPMPTSGIGKITPRMLLGERATLVVTQVPKWKDGKEVSGQFQNQISKWLTAGTSQTFEGLID